MTRRYYYVKDVEFTARKVVHMLNDRNAKLVVVSIAQDGKGIYRFDIEVQPDSEHHIYVTKPEGVRYYPVSHCTRLLRDWIDEYVLTISEAPDPEVTYQQLLERAIRMIETLLKMVEART